ncbi:hypothetical protein [Micromonospora echinofusca]|uniref:Uncharacterized protein n=1 Tax=Micromonospora echinofusca TaxID=47858 RepID=A0ABS3VNP4_MICEH|nr:hypothetical protein [Micromonospora echinofusca]MBO4206162.1 hypothetical protein [Micromonospora echinofusca]
MADLFKTAGRCRPIVKRDGIRIDDTMIGSPGRILWTSDGVLEQRRFAFLLGGPSGPDGVLAALDAYRRADDGTRSAWSPTYTAGQPISLSAALRVLEETGSLHGDRAIRICDWAAGHAARRRQRRPGFPVEPSRTPAPALAADHRRARGGFY